MKLLPLLKDALFAMGKGAYYVFLRGSEKITHKERERHDAAAHGYEQQAADDFRLLFEGATKQVPASEWTEAEEAAFCARHGFAFQPLTLEVVL